MNNKNISKGLFPLLVVYIVWGSTYLAMRVTVRAGSGFEAFSVGWTRLFLASIIIFVIAKLSGRFVIPKKKELIYLAVTGLLLWLCGHGLVLWSEKYVASSYAALFVGTVPIWIMIIEAILEKRMPKLLPILFVIIGFIGLLVLIFPNLKAAGFSGNYFSIVTLFFGSLCWGLGIILQKRFAINLPSMTISAFQHLFGGIGFLIISLLLREKFPTPSLDAWLALGFLVVFGSVVAFTCFIKAVKLLPNSVVVTHAYVNPVVALILGYLILKEEITTWTLIGAGLILFSVISVLTYKKRGLK